MAGNAKAPILNLRRGSVQVAVWENEAEGRKYFSAKLTHRYRDKKSGEWKDTQYLTENDMLVASALLREAWVAACVRDEGPGTKGGVASGSKPEQEQEQEEHPF